MDQENKLKMELDCIEKARRIKEEKEDIEELFDISQTIRTNRIERDLCETFSVDKPSDKKASPPPSKDKNIPPSNIEELRAEAESKIELVDSIEITQKDIEDIEEAINVAEAIKNKRND